VERLLRFRAVERPRLQHHREGCLRVCQHHLENWRVDSYSDLMTDAFTESLEAKVAEVAAIEDLLTQGRAALDARQQLAKSDQDLYAIQQAAVRGLRPGRTWAEVGELFGRSYAWAEAIAKGRSAKRGKTDHAAESTPRAGAAEGHFPDTEQPEQP
jgi:hypothetical protein